MTVVHYQMARAELTRVTVRRRLFFNLLTAYLAFLALLGLAIAIFLPPVRSNGLWVIAIVALLFSAQYVAVLMVLARAPWLYGPTTVEFDREGVRVAYGDSIRNELRWSAFGRWTQNRDYFFVSLGAATWTVPKRAFDEAQLREFEECLRAVGSRPKPA